MIYQTQKLPYELIIPAYLHQTFFCSNFRENNNMLGLWWKCLIRLNTTRLSWNVGLSLLVASFKILWPKIWSTNQKFIIVLFSNCHFIIQILNFQISNFFHCALSTPPPLFLLPITTTDPSKNCPFYRERNKEGVYIR